ncbi:MAG: hypothetical protein GC139_07080 [Sideroxydans sp.]|nr:hypothetical protein [Sideroxydans sp.]
MRRYRLLLPLLFAFVLLFAQQVGAAHTLSHTLADMAQQQDKTTPHSQACEKCEHYAQMGSALSVGAFDFTPPAFSGEAIQHSVADFQSIHTLVAVARGPPARLQSIA